MDEARARAAAEAVARGSYGRLLAYLTARTRDVAGAEDALADAFATALAEWPHRGVPDRPEAWLATVGRRKLIDAARRRGHRDASAGHLRLIADELDEAAQHAGDIPDERLSLMFACAHPAMDRSVRAPLMLQTILGFDATTIASAFLIAPATMSQRLVRAKAKIRQAGVPFRVPERAELSERLESVLDAIYATYAEGWVDPAGTDTRRRNLAEEAIWLGRLVVTLLPEEPEALGLVSLMLHTEARRTARRDYQGGYVPLAEQDCSIWDAALIDEAEALLLRAATMERSGRYQLEAAVQSVHAARRVAGRTDWQAIVVLYDMLITISASPVVAMNRAVAIAETQGAHAGLAVLEDVASDARMAEYQPYWAARAGLLTRVGDLNGATLAYQQAIGLEPDPAVRQFLQRRMRELHTPPTDK